MWLCREIAQWQLWQLAPFQTRRGTRPRFFPCPWGGSKWCSPAVPFPAHRLDEARPHSLAAQAAQLAFKVALEANCPAILNLCDLCVSFRKMSPLLPLQSSSIYLMQLEMPNSGQSGSLADLNLKLSRRNVQQSALKPHLHETSESSIMLIVCHCSASLMLWATLQTCP